MLAKQAPAGRPETKVESARRNVWFFVCVPDPAAKGAFMQILVSRACGIDVHKDMLAVCVLVYRDGKEPEARYKEFASHQKALTALGNWLSSQKVTHVVMESTGVYWKPVWYALENDFQLVLANPFQVKALPGKKTDKRDSHWLAELLAHGLVAGSFVPPQETRALRDLTRYRVKLSEEMNRIQNRIHKVLEDASIKLDTVVSHILGGTGRSVIEGIIEGKESPRQLAERAQGSLRGKRAQLELAVHGRVSEHHRFRDPVRLDLSARFKLACIGFSKPIL
jgi:transposase